MTSGSDWQRMLDQVASQLGVTPPGGTPAPAVPASATTAVSDGGGFIVNTAFSSPKLLPIMPSSSGSITRSAVPVLMAPVTGGATALPLHLAPAPAPALMQAGFLGSIKPVHLLLAGGALVVVYLLARKKHP